MITKEQYEDLEFSSESIEACARKAAEKPDPFNLILLGRALEAHRSLLRRLRETSK